MKTVNCVQLVGPLTRGPNGTLSLVTERWQRGRDGQQHRVEETHALTPATAAVRLLLARLPAGTRCFVEGALATEQGGVQPAPPPVLVHTVVLLALGAAEPTS